MTPATPPAGGSRARLRTDVWAALVGLILCSGALTAIQIPSTERSILVDGATFERAAVQGEAHRYDAELTAGDFLEVSVSQDQLRVELTLSGPDGLVLHKINLPDIEPLAERLMFVAPVSGRYVIEVRVGNPTPPEERPGINPGPHRYALQVVGLRRATADDRVRAARFELLERASALARLETMDGLVEAIRVFREVAAEWRAIGDVTLEASTLEALAGVSLFTQFHLDLIAARERLAELYDATGNREQAVTNWRLLGTRYLSDGRLVDGQRALGRARELALALGWSASAARTERLLGVCEFELGNYERARDLANEAQARGAALPDPGLAASAMWDLARLDELAGDLDAAIARYRRALDLAAGIVPTTALITMSLGFDHLRRGELEEAASRFSARLSMAKTFVNRDQEAYVQIGLGDVSLARGDRESARKHYQAAAAALQTGFQVFRCTAEQRLGRMDLDEGRLDQARVSFETMLEIAARVQHPPCEAEGRAGLADVAARRGDLETAETEALRVVTLTESFREAAVSLESRALGFGALAPAYERAIDISMRRAARGDEGALARALTLNEQALARGLLDRIVEARLDTTARAPAALVTEHHQVRERWRAGLAELQIAMRSSPDAPKTKALVDETRALAVHVRDLAARIDAADPRHGSFVRPRPLDLAAMQALLDDETVFLEYALGEQRSYLWVVSSHDVHAFTLAPGAAIEALARNVRDGLGRSPASATEAGLHASEADRRELTRLVLEPAAVELSGRRLVVIPAGALSLVPFGALPAPGPAAQPLIARHEIVQIPSATILHAMRMLTAGRARPAKTAVIFADPVFDRHDTRVRSASMVRRDQHAAAATHRLGPTVPPSPDGALQTVRVRGMSLTRLPFSGNEAAAIASLAPSGITTLLGPAATRERALDRTLADYRFLHFATHSVVNEDVPSLSSIALSMVDRSGRPRDGLVMLPDVYDMTLNADLVVLSGCQTALGKNIRGEGSIGLARGFMYAGVPRVVASLWQVSDLGTAELMKRFYRGMLVDGLTPAAALRIAQRELATNPRWASPYFWAPFILQGDWR